MTPVGAHLGTLAQSQATDSIEEKGRLAGSQGVFGLATSGHDFFAFRAQVSCLERVSESRHLPALSVFAWGFRLLVGGMSLGVQGNNSSLLQR